MKADLGWVRLRRFELELALEAAFESGTRFQPLQALVDQPAAWSDQARAESAEAFQKRQYVDEERARRKVAFEANVKVLSAVGQTIQANAQAVEAVSRLVDNMGRLS